MMIGAGGLAGNVIGSASAADVLRDGDVIQIENVKSGLLLGPYNNSRVVGMDIEQRAKSSTGAQSWKLKGVPGQAGYWNLINTTTGQCLANRSSSHVEGTPIIQWTCMGLNDQAWKFEPRGNQK